MLDQLIIGDVCSYIDYEASVAERRIIKPKKKSIKETVPFSNVTHDFSAIHGELYWGETELEYVFEITADSAEELEEKKQPFRDWIMNVMNAELHDPFIKDYHFLATFSDIEEDDSEIEKSTITVKFTAYPYMISDFKRVYTFPLTVAETTVKITNNSSHRITPTLKTDVECVVKKGNSSFGIPAGEITDEQFMLSPGSSELSICSTGGSGTLKIEFYEEVF